MTMIAANIENTDAFSFSATLCFRPWREEGLGEAPAGEQGADESVQGESECFKVTRMPKFYMVFVCCFHLKEKKGECQGKHPTFPQEESAVVKERKALAMTEGSVKRSACLAHSQSAASPPRPVLRRAS